MPFEVAKASMFVEKRPDSLTKELIRGLLGDNHVSLGSSRASFLCSILLMAWVDPRIAKSFKFKLPLGALGGVQALRAEGFV